MTAAEAEVLRLVNAQRTSATAAVRCRRTPSFSRSPAPTALTWRHEATSTTPAPTAAARSTGCAPPATGATSWARTSPPASQPAAAVMDAWMHSAGHRANILNCGYQVIGIGVATKTSSPYRIYWTQDFGDR